MEDKPKKNKQEMGRILSSRELQGFWEDIERMRAQRMGKLLRERDATVIDGINAIDNIVALAEKYSK